MTANPTLYDVAREAGVSLATASRALNGSTRVVKPEYRERVLAAATRLGYTANLPAQAVARGASTTVALVVSDISDPYFAAIAAGVIRAAEADGLVVTIAVTNRVASRELELVKMLRGQRPRAIVLAGSRLTSGASEQALVAELEGYRAGGGRVAIISQRGLPFDTVEIDNTGGARELALAAVSLGYRGFAILAGPSDLVTARDRSTAFAEQLPSAPLAVLHSDFTRDAGYAAMSSLIDAGLTDVDFVFAVNDVMAIGALTALRDHQISVPQRVALAGFDDVATARDVSPTLTTVHVDLEDAGAAAVALALGDEQFVSVPTSVVLRESTPGR
jgi:LacI family transcriptional regulator